jgi:hypothetical protein
MKNAIGITLLFGIIVAFVWSSGPRLMGDVLHARDFVPAQGYTITKYECTNWNAFMFNDCTVTFVSPESRESRQFTDWRFGPAPSDPVRLLQRRDDASSLTTNVSLQTVWNRALVALILVGLGALSVIKLVGAAFKAEDAPVGAPSRASALEPMGRSSFGKRQA